jgi:hypothetical protein
MKPLTLEFKEIPTGVDLDYSLIEYDNELNLSVNKLTRQPAIENIEMDTTTFTKAGTEESDTDFKAIQMLLDTEMVTLVDSEGTVSDKDRIALNALLDTTTLTESSEVTDQDKDWQ